MSILDEDFFDELAGNRKKEVKRNNLQKILTDSYHKKVYNETEWIGKRNRLIKTFLSAEKNNIRTREKADSKMVDQLIDILEREMKE